MEKKKLIPIVDYTWLVRATSGDSLLPRACLDFRHCWRLTNHGDDDGFAFPFAPCASRSLQIYKSRLQIAWWKLNETVNCKYCHCKQTVTVTDVTVDLYNWNVPYPFGPGRAWRWYRGASYPPYPRSARPRAFLIGGPIPGNINTEVTAYSDTLGTREKCQRNQIVTVTRGSLVRNQSFGTC